MVSSLRLASSARGCAGSTVPSAISRRTSDVIWLWCMGWSLSIFRADDGKRRFGGLCCRTAESHALEWPLDLPSAIRQAFEKIVSLGNGVDQQRAALACNDVADQRQRVICMIRK